MTNSVKISCGELREYVQSYKSVTFTPEGCKIRGKFGVVEFDLSQFSPEKISAHLKRGGGNGKIVIGEEELAVGSKTYQTFDIDTSDIVTLSRPKDSTGDVTLLGFTLSTSVSEKAVGINWKDIINQCGKYSCLRLVKGRLFASTGGFLENGNIISDIVTNPPGASSREGGKIRFKNSCEILRIELRGNQNPVARSTELYTSREPPTPIHVPQPQDGENRYKRPGGNAAMHPQKYQHQLPNFDDHILYDSSASKNFANFITARNQGVKQVRSNNSVYLVINKGGAAKATLSQLKNDTHYICILNGKKLSGNGRVYVGASIDQNFSGEACEAVFTSNFSNKYVRFKTGKGAPNSMQKIHITMPERFCHGEIIIQRIIIVEDLGIDHARTSLEGKKFLSIDEVPRPPTPSISFSFNMDVYRRDDAVYVAAKKFAMYPHIQSAPLLDSNISGTIMANNVSGLVWASRVKSVFDNIRIGNMKSESVHDSLLISHLGHLKPAKNIWIEPFEFESNISDSDRQAIEKAEKIMSPSLSNVQYLHSKFEDKKIVQAHRPLPWVEPDVEPMFNDMDFVVTFDRGKKQMKKLFNVWSNNLPPLVVIGARGRYPDFVIPFNEYYPYRKLLFLMQKARFIIDMPEHCDYHSSLLDLANVMGKIIVSTNWFVLDKPSGIFLPNKDDTPQSVALDAIQQAMDSKSEAGDMNLYHNKFISHVETLLSS